MASLSTTKRNGKTCYQIWVGNEPDRFNVWLGKISKSSANEIFSHVIQLETSKNGGSAIRPITQEWLNSIAGRLHKRLVKAELCPPRAATRVNEFFDERLEKLDCADRTRDIYRRALDKFNEFLADESLLLRDISPAQASEFYNVHLKKLDIKDSYRGKIAKVVREFFGRAVKLKLIFENPFQDVEISGSSDQSRHVYIDRKLVHQVIDSATDARWKAMLGFSALCGLRTRSEIAALKWEHIHWDTNTFTVPKCKTAERTVPLFGDFRPLIDQYHANCIAPDPLVPLNGSIFPNCPSQTQLTNRLNRTIARAGLQPWGKPWMNLRSSAETWMVRQGFDLTTVTRWLGNSPNIAQKHYLQVTPDDINKAATLTTEKFSNSFQNAGEQGGIANQETQKKPEIRIESTGKYIRRDSNPQPSVPKTDALSS